MNNELIRCENLEIGYDRGLLPPFNLSIKTGHFWGVAGPNGAGKTTLIKTLTKILRPLSGNVSHASNLSFGFVPQRHSLPYIFPLSAEKVIEMGLFENKVFVKKAGNYKKRVEEVMELLDIANLSSRLFSSLSGGQQQRVLIARALSKEPDILVLDEPASGLDIVATKSILELCKTLNKDKNQTLIMISHEMEHLKNYADSVILINREKNFFQSGTTTEVLTEKSVRNLFGVA